jgi:hypothetical protein
VLQSALQQQRSVLFQRDPIFAVVEVCNARHTNHTTDVEGRENMDTSGGKVQAMAQAREMNHSNETYGSF